LYRQQCHLEKRIRNESGEARSLLISTTSQKVEKPALDLSVKLDEGEPMHTEIPKNTALRKLKPWQIPVGFKWWKTCWIRKGILLIPCGELNNHN
jgi:uncharacterized SAM-dependent methyltransferase